eukprot:s4778_g3.t2
MMTDMQRLHSTFISVLRQGAAEFDPDFDMPQVTERMEVFTCPCGKQFSTPQGLALHRVRAHQQYAPEHRFINGASCPNCLRFFWSSARLQQHLAYIPRGGGANRCYQALLDQNYSTDYQAEAIPRPLCGALRLDALQAAGPLPLRPHAGLIAIEEIQDEINTIETELQVTVRPEDHLAADLGDWWLRLLFTCDAWAELVFLSWGEHILPDLLADALDGNIEFDIERTFLDIQQTMPSTEGRSRLTWLRQRLRFLQGEIDAEPQPHRPVRTGTANQHERMTTSQKVPSAYMTQADWLEILRTARHQQLETTEMTEEERRRLPRPLRSFERILGLDGLKIKELEQLHAGSSFFLQTTILLAYQLVIGGYAISEHPAPPQDASRASIWTTPWIQLLRQHPAVQLHVVSQWRFGASVPKPTGLLAARLPKFLRSLYRHADANLRKPQAVAIGRNADGSFKTSCHKEYPPLFSAGIVSVITDQLDLDFCTGEISSATTEDSRHSCPSPFERPEIFESSPQKHQDGYGGKLPVALPMWKAQQENSRSLPKLQETLEQRCETQHDSQDIQVGRRRRQHLGLGGIIQLRGQASANVSKEFKSKAQEGQRKRQGEEGSADLAECNYSRLAYLRDHVCASATSSSRTGDSRSSYTFFISNGSCNSCPCGVGVCSPETMPRYDKSTSRHSSGCEKGGPEFVQADWERSPQGFKSDYQVIETTEYTEGCKSQAQGFLAETPQRFNCYFGSTDESLSQQKQYNDQILKAKTEINVARRALQSVSKQAGSVAVKTEEENEVPEEDSQEHVAEEQELAKQVQVLLEQSAALASPAEVQDVLDSEEENAVSSSTVSDFNAPQVAVEDLGRSAGATYLKQLANQRVVRVNRKSSLSPSTAASETDLASPRSTSVDSPQESPAMQEPSMEIIDQTMILLGLDPNTACSQYHIYEAVEELTGEWKSTPLAAPDPPSMVSMPDDTVVNPRDQLSLIDSRKRPHAEVQPQKDDEVPTKCARTDEEPTAPPSDPASPPTTPAEAVGSCKWMQGYATWDIATSSTKGSPFLHSIFEQWGQDRNPPQKKSISNRKTWYA